MLKYMKHDLFFKSNFFEWMSEKLGFGEKEKWVSKDTLPKDKKAPVMDESKSEREELSADVLKTITNKEFLKLSIDKRLKHITNPKVDYSQVASGEVKNMNFTFTFDGVFNKEFYLKTTAGQILPPEVKEIKVWEEIYSRKWIAWEFFNAGNRRLIIQEWTKIDIPSLRTKEDVVKIEKENQASYETVIQNSPDSNKEIVKEAIKRWIEPNFANIVFKEIYEATPENDKKVVLEDMFSEFDRVRWEYGFSPELENWKYDSRLVIWFLKSFDQANYKSIATKYWITDDQITQSDLYFKSKEWFMFWWIDLTKISIDWVSENELAEIKAKKEFKPGERDTQILFLAACQSAWLPESLCNENLHKILKRESAGIVGRLNYTITSLSQDEFKSKANASKWDNPIWSVSTASWLWQLLLSNVDKYYPDGRNGIGDSMNEAVWMLRYIHDRYGSTDIAWEMYGTTGNYTHPTKWIQPKWFKEWY